MECEWIVEKVRIHAAARIQGDKTARGCRISLPLLEPSGDVINVMAEHNQRQGSYYVTDGGRLNGLLFESGPAGPTAADRHAVYQMAQRATLTFDDERRVFYAIADERTLGYWVFEIGRTIAAVASMVPRGRRRRTGRRLSTHVIRQLQEELLEQGLLGLITGPRQIPGITKVPRRVDLTYRAGPGTGQAYDVFVIAADLGTANPLRPAQNTVITAHDLHALQDKPTVRIVHGLVEEGNGANESSRAEDARRLIESAASVSRIEEYSWDDVGGKGAFVEVTRQELARSAQASEGARLG